MRGLSFTDPWGTLVALGHKRYETRSWPTDYTGLVAIHVSKSMGINARWAASHDPIYSLLTEAGYRPKPGYAQVGQWPSLPLGKVIAVARLVGCVSTGRIINSVTSKERALGDFSDGRFAFKFADVRRLPEPIPWRGALGLWVVPDELRGLIEAQIESVAV